MPLYDYDCAACGRRFEVVHGVHSDGPTTCPLCGKGPVRKAITAAAIHFKGSGWAKKERGASARSSAAMASGDDGPPSGSGSDDGAKSDSKGDAKSDSSKESVSKDAASKDDSSKSEDRGSGQSKDAASSRRSKAAASRTTDSSD